MKFLLLFLLFFLVSCTTAPSSEEWPADMPSLGYLQDYYQQDIDNQKTLSERAYLNWIYRFYYGWELYSRGWFQATDELVASLTSPEQKRQGRQLMEEIGLLIAPEWAKNDPYRVINTRHVALWGNVILKGMLEQNQLPLLYQIRADVKQLLNSEMTAIDIKKDRYITDENFGNDDDDDF